MKKGEKKGIIVSIVLFLIAILISKLIKFPLYVDNIFIIIGVMLALIISYFFFESKKIFLFTVLGLLFIFSNFIIVELFLKKKPSIVVPILMLLTLLAIIFTGLAAYKAIKELFDKFKK